MFIRNVLTLLACMLAISSQAQETVGTNGGFAKTDRLSVSWTMGQPTQAYLQSSNGIYTVGYQQPNMSVALLKPENRGDEEIWGKVFPNPVFDELSIRLVEKFAVEEVSIQLFSADGKPLKSLKNQGQTDLQIDFSQFPAGNYLLRLDSNGKNQVYSIIKHVH